VVLANLTYPTSVDFDDAGNLFIAEGGYIYGDDVAPARIIRVSANGDTATVADNLSGPVTDLLWHDKRLYISHRGKISVLEPSGVRDLLTGLPSEGDHHNNQLAIGPDGKLYFGQGTATNSGIVGLDSFKMGWLAKYPDVHDVPAKDIRVTDQAFETPDPFSLFADKRKEHGEHGSSHEKQQAKDQSSDAGKAHEGHGATPQESRKTEATATGHGGHAVQGTQGQAPKDDHHKHADHNSKGSADAKTHEEHAAHAADAKKGSSGEAPSAKQTAHGHEGHHGSGQSQHGQHENHGAVEKTPQWGPGTVKTYVMQPFGKTPPDDGAMRGTTKANGTILRMNLDGSDLEVYAWGLRNPFGVMWGPDDELYVSDNGYDERGSRPIAHAPDCLWRIKQGAWYGFPDYAAGIPVTDARFRPEKGPAPKFLMRDHPMPEKPLAELTHHVGAAKIDYSHNDRFGFKGQLFVALAGDMNPNTGHHEERSGFEVIRMNPEDGSIESFFNAKKEALGPKGFEYVTTAGPRRPVDVRFSPDGSALYVVDIGAMAVLSTASGPAPRPFPMTGVIWRIVRDESPRTATGKSAPHAQSTAR
jgi:glucose/arabinose dehydrogenase